MISVLLIEDEFHTREGIKKMLSLIDTDIKIVGETESVSEAVPMIKDTKPDIILIDIMLSDGTGFDILDHKIYEIKPKPYLIFITSHSKYAIRAFKYSAIDYLLKPISPIELKAAIKRASQMVNDTKEYHKLLSTLKSNVKSKEQVIVLNTSNERHFVKVNEIIRLEADGAYTKFICTSQKLIVSRNIKHYQSVLDDHFIRCHQSHVVNIKKIKGLHHSTLELSNGDIVPISTRKKTKVIQRLNSSFNK